MYRVVLVCSQVQDVQYATCVCDVTFKKEKPKFGRWWPWVGVLRGSLVEPNQILSTAVYPQNFVKMWVRISFPHAHYSDWIVEKNTQTSSVPAVKANNNNNNNNNNYTSWACHCLCHPSWVSLQWCYLLCPGSQSSHPLCHPDQASLLTCLSLHFPSE